MKELIMNTTIEGTGTKEAIEDWKEETWMMYASTYVGAVEQNRLVRMNMNLNGKYNVTKLFFNGHSNEERSVYIGYNLSSAIEAWNLQVDPSK